MSQFNPVSAALDAQRTLLDAGSEAFQKSEVAEDRVARMQEVEVGQTPSRVAYRENKLELLHYESQTDEQSEVPILVVYALINRPYILDLQPDRSVVRRLLEAGHDVYLIDWNEPSWLDQHLTLGDYINRYIENCVDVVRERSDQDAINVLGYCMGGTMSAIYAALNPEKVNALGLMAAGLCFDDSAGTLELWGDSDFYDPEDVTETFGNMPGEMLDIGFALMDPVDNYVSKYVRLYDNIEDEDFVANFGRMEKWLSEGIDVAGEAYVEFLEDLYQDNELYRNEFYLDGEHVDVTDIDMPVLQILGEYDHLIPASASRPFNEVVGSDDVSTIEYPTGHIGLSVSGSSHEDVWPEVAEWFHDRTPTEPEEPEAAAGPETEMTEADPAATEGSDLEEVEGIGPTYAERLREAGVGSVVDLAGADPETVADAAEVGESRAREWVATARVSAEADLAAEEVPDEELPGHERSDAELTERAESDVSEEPAPPGEMEVDEEVVDELVEEDLETDAPEDLEEVEGIGPAYAERLREAGVESVADLAGADPETVADAAEVGESRAREWVEQARSRS